MMQISTRVAWSGVMAALILSWSAACTPSKDNDPVNTLHLPVEAKIKGLDPAQASDMYAGTQVGYAYEGLLQYHYLKRPYVLVPSLAAAMPTLSDGGKTLTFKIKPGVLFQDDPCFKETKGKGRELVAEDFVYSFKRLADAKLLSEGWWVFDGKIVGLNEWREANKDADKTNYDMEVEGLKALDRYTLQIKLIRPSHQFLYYLAMPFTLVVPREAVEMYGKDFVRNPVGTGPYRLVREETNLASKLIWDRNPTYRDEFYPSEGEPEDKASGLLRDAGKKLPFADRIVVRVFVETQPQWLEFLNGNLDRSGIPKDNFAQAITPSSDLSADLEKKGIKLLKSPMMDITFNAFNMKDPVVGGLDEKKKYLRQALSLVYHIDPVIEKFYNGRGIPAQTPIPPGVAGYDPKYKNPYRQLNVNLAKELLAKAGYPKGEGLPPIEYVTNTSSFSRQLADYTAQCFKEIGVELKVTMYSWPEFQKAVNNHKGQIFGFAWGADYPDAENFLQLFYSKNVSPGPNNSNYQNPKFDALYEKSLTMPDSPERTRLYREMAMMVVEDSPWIFGIHRISYGLHHSWLTNDKVFEFTQTKQKYLRVDGEARKAKKATF